MNYSNFRFTLNMHSHRSQASVSVFRGDTAVSLHFSLTDGGNTYYIGDGCTAILSGTKADGKKLWNRCVIENNTTIRYDFTEETATAVGIADCEITLYSKDGRVVTAPKFIIVVDEREVGEDLLSVDERDALDAIWLAEVARVEAETARSQDEIVRAEAEDERVNNEITRENNELTRVSAEANRKSAETARASAETKRVAAETARASAETARVEAETARAEAEEARQSAEEERKKHIGITSIEQSFVSDDDGGENVLTVTLSDGATLDFFVKNGTKGGKGDRGEKGEPFTVAKVFSSVAEMNNAYATDGVAVGSFVVIESSVEDADNAKLFLKGNTSYEFLTDLSGAQGMKGEKGDDYVLTDADKSEIVAKTTAEIKTEKAASLEAIKAKTDSSLSEIEATTNEKLSEIVSAANIVQTTGDSEMAVMSQQAVTRKLNDLAMGISAEAGDVLWEQGAIASGNGVNSEATHRLRTNNYINFQSVVRVYVTNPSYSFLAMVYDEFYTYLGYSKDWIQEVDLADLINTYPNGEYIRFVLRKNNNTATSVDVDVLASGFSVVLSDIKKVKSVAEATAEQLGVIPVDFYAYGIYSSNGVAFTSTSRCSTRMMPFDKNLKISVNQPYRISLYLYSGDSYVGSSDGWLYRIVNLSDYSERGADSFRLLISRIDDGEFSDGEIENLKQYITIYSDDSVIFKLNKDIAEQLGIVPLTFELGTIDSTSGKIHNTTQTSVNRCRSYPIKYDENMIVCASDVAQFCVHLYNNGQYLGNNGGWSSGVLSLESYKNKNVTDVILVVKDNNDSLFSNETVSWFADKITVVYKNSVFSNVINPKCDYTSYGLPILSLSGDTSQMTKDNAVTLDYTYGTQTGTCTCKWQGSSSVSRGYPKRNYTIKFDNAFEAKEGWGLQKKYCMKANWIDPSAARNVVNARLWGQVVASRSNVHNTLVASANYGAIDGFPIIITINGAYEGLYTFNIPKDGWMMAMGSGENEYMVVSESNDLAACKFRGLAVLDETDFSIEYKPDSVDDSTVATSFNTLLQAVINAGEDWETTLSPYLDIDSVVDYFIFVNCIGGHDNLGKNIIYGTYDGVKWFMSAYDLDTTYGSNPYGIPTTYSPSAWFKVVNDRNQFLQSTYMHRLSELMYKHSRARLKARYAELRRTVLSDENVWYMLTNFVNEIPRSVYNADADKWKTMPATATANISTYMDFYRMHCAYLDKEVEALQ